MIEMGEGGKPDHLLVPPRQFSVPPGELVREPCEYRVHLGHPVPAKRHVKPDTADVSRRHGR